MQKYYQASRTTFRLDYLVELVWQKLLVDRDNIERQVRSFVRKTLRSIFSNATELLPIRTMYYYNSLFVTSIKFKYPLNSSLPPAVQNPERNETF